eukprot:Nk52_evm1s2576 gene=Nk52_evmTU1s2576
MSGLSSLSSLRSCGRGLFNKQYRIQQRVVLPSIFARGYAGGASKADIEQRVMDVLKSFDKIEQKKLAMDAHFVNDLGLDSLDTVEVVMAFEDEFSIEIPDADAENIFTAADAVKYISTTSGAL